MVMLPGCLNLHKLFNDWIHIPAFIYRITELSNPGKVLISILYGKIESDGVARISRKDLTEELSWSISTLDRAIRDLKECGLIYTVQENENSPSEYHFRDYKGYHDLIGGTVKNDSRVLSRPTDGRGGTVKNDRTIKTILHKELSKESTKNLEQQGSERTIKRRNKPLAKNMEQPTLKLKLRSRKLAKTGNLPTSKINKKSNSPGQSRNVIQNTLTIPKRTQEALDYWRSKPCLPKMVINADNPTKRLKETIKALGHFFSGELFRGHAYLNSKLSSATIDELSELNSLDDFKEFVDTWEEVITSNKYKVNPTYLKKVTLQEWLMGNPYVQNNNGGMYSSLVEYCFFEPPLAVEDHNPKITLAIIKQWEDHIGNSDKFQKEDFVKASNFINAYFKSEYKRTGIDPSGSSIYSGALYLAVTIIVDNKEFLSSKNVGPMSLLGKWAREQYSALWRKQ